MIFTETDLAGAWIVDLERLEDERGFFARAFCREAFRERGLESEFAQSSLAYSHVRGTLRGLHYQIAPAAEVKLVRCTRGAMWTVIVDLRPGSATRFRHVAVALDAENRRSLYVPEGFAQGYQTLVGGTEASYQMSRPYSPEHARTLRFDDPELAIDWPLPVTLVSPRDADAEGVSKLLRAPTDPPRAG